MFITPTSVFLNIRNARELLDWPIELKIPKRPIQLEMCRYMFMVSYALIAALGTAILITVSGKWPYFNLKKLKSSCVVGKNCTFNVVVFLLAY